MKSNRYIISFAGVILHLMLGSTYAWSVYRNPIIEKTGWDQASVAFAFSLAIFCLGLSAAFMGRLVEKFGPRVMGSLSAFLYAGGNILTGFAIDRQELWLLYLAYGILGGLGLGAGYITPVSTIIKWFPDKRGLATGLAIMGFGFASLLTSPIAQHLIAGVGLVETFYILGASYFIIMLLASQFIKRPNEQELAILSASGKEKTDSLTQGMTANQALKSNRFYILWIIFFINIACGLGLISAASPMAQEMAGLSTSHAAVMVGVLGIFNGFGRLLWASLSDYIGRPLTFSILLLVNLFFSLSLWLFTDSVLFVVAMSILMTCYGAGFSLIPAYLSDIFGAKELAALHGYILTAWAMAGLAGPILLVETYKMAHSYTQTLFVFLILYSIALALSYYLGRSIKKESQKPLT